MLTALNHLENLEYAAYRRGSEHVLTPRGWLEVVARNWEDGFRTTEFDYWYFAELHGGNEIKIDRTIAAGLMAEKWSTTYANE